MSFGLHSNSPLRGTSNALVQHPGGNPLTILSQRVDYLHMALFTAANASQMAAKSHLARRTKTASAKLAAEDAVPLERLSAQKLATGAADPYVAGRLARVRKQLDRLDRLMCEEADPQRLDRLASAQYRLSEQERILAGRPLPGSIRRKQEPEARRQSISEPSGPLGVALELPGV